jgi:16S rRNA (adenine1518-N6/adenine1519-N6)-dimethyltransferase
LRRNTGTGIARKRFGQHFLESRWAEKVVKAVGARPSDVILEIGPGRGAITHLLGAAAARVIAFEIDRDLVPVLRDAAGSNVTIVEGDFLDLTAQGVRVELGRTSVSPDASLRVAGNLPYNVASRILFKLLELIDDGLPITDAVVMLQREVADRLTARPGTREYGVLSVLIGHRAEVRRLLTLPPGAFRPQPNVQSAVVSLRFHPPSPRPANPAVFESLTKAIFTRRRKTLANALLAYRADGTAEALSRSGLDGRRRPETLDIPELVALSDAFLP